MISELSKDELPSCRAIFDELTPCKCTNAGLWLDRFSQTLGGKGGKQQMLEAVCGKESQMRVPRPYVEYFERRKMRLEKAGAFVGAAEVLGRMVVGLGAESVMETSIALHRTYGVPYIPGSALKGLASAAAHRLLARDDWRKAVNGKPQGESHKIMFGEKDNAGHVTFHDALFIPSVNEERLPLDLDVMTVHHRHYYGSGKLPPTDFDSPNPISFLTAHGKYLIAIEGPRNWLEAAWEILKIGLAEEGIGAKTAAGYGRLKLEEPEFVTRERSRIKRAEARMDEIVRGFTWKSTAKSVLGDLLVFMEDEATRDVARATLLSLYDKHKEYWRDWRKNHDAAQWDALGKHDLLPPLLVPQNDFQSKPKVQTVGPVWEIGSAWIAPDKRNRPTLFFLRQGEKKPEDRNTKDVQFLGDVIEDELDHATQEQPVSVDVLREGKKIKQVRRVSSPGRG